MPYSPYTMSLTSVNRRKPASIKLMRIVFCSESYPPVISGVAVFVARSAVELIKRGHQVIVICPSTTGLSSVEEENGLTVHRLLSVPNIYRKKPRLVFGQQLTINKILREFKPDIVHIQDIGGCSSAGLRWARRHRVPVIGTRHFATSLFAAYVPLGKAIPKEALHSLIDAYSAEFFRRCTLITVPTETVRQELLQQKLKVPIEVVTNGVDIPEEFERQVDPDAIPIVLTVSRIDEDKNIPLILRAAPLVAAIRQVRFVIVGDGARLAQYREYIAEHKLKSIIEFTGSFPSGSRELLHWYETATLLAMPSLVETQSLVTLEAMARELPVVAVPVGALPELVHHNQTGYLLTKPTADEMAEMIIYALDHPKETAACGKRARAFVLEHHARDKATDRLIEVYQKILNR
jgi:glycosyltransferase involved in cell wall biosynthesis